MPAKPKTNKRRPKRARRVIGTNNKLTKQGALRRTILPARLPTRLKFELCGTTTSLTTVLHSLVIRANSIFDPLFSGGGNQYRGYDQLATLYNKYKVHGIFVKASIQVITNTAAYIGMATVPDNLAIPTTTNGAMESRRCFGRIVGKDNDKVHVIQQYYPITTIEEITKKEFSDDDYSADFGQNPTKDPHIAIQVGSPDQITATEANYNIECTVYLTCSQSKMLAQSVP